MTVSTETWLGFPDWVKEKDREEIRKGISVTVNLTSHSEIGIPSDTTNTPPSTTFTH